MKNFTKLLNPDEKTLTSKTANNVGRNLRRQSEDLTEQIEGLEEKMLTEIADNAKNTPDDIIKIMIKIEYEIMGEEVKLRAVKRLISRFFDK